MKRTLRSTIVLTALSLVSAGGVCVWGQEQPRPQQVELPARDASDARIPQAATHHEVIQVLLDEGRFQEVLPEFQAILDLELTGDKERLVAKSAWQIVSRLREKGQSDVAHSIVDMTLVRMQRCENEFPMLMLRAKVFQDQRRYQDALRTLRQARQLPCAQEIGSNPR